jgi:BRCT domain type II-containing protein
LEKTFVVSGVLKEFSRDSLENNRMEERIRKFHFGKTDYLIAGDMGPAKN